MKSPNFAWVDEVNYMCHIFLLPNSFAAEAGDDIFCVNTE
jgi:hypothetical protein